MPKAKKRFSFLKKLQKAKKNIFSHPLLYKLVGLLLILSSLIVLTYKLPISKNLEKSPIVINEKLLESKETKNIPVRILIPKADIDLKVTPSKVVKGYWELSETTASYGLGSGNPRNKSNTVIFAHAREGLFLNLKDVKLGDTIYVFTKDKWFRYKVNKITAVYPNNIEVIKPTKDETLTLYTCSGFYDEKRLIVTAVPSG
ncbi:MAG: sortase [Candidatus Levybacteria bacterium]|nr:sortase [Candidatus Levybacteria bacterium]